MGQIEAPGEMVFSPAPLGKGRSEPTLAEKVAFLSRSGTYGLPEGSVLRLETHMSWIFLAGERVYKLKKPVRFAYLDFSTVSLRESACRAELALNRRLAADVYLDVVPLVMTSCGLALDGAGFTADWLVVMRRLDETRTVEQMILGRRLMPSHLSRLAATLAAFYRHASAAHVSPALLLAVWRRSLADNRRVLLDPRLGLPSGLVRRIDRAQRHFLEARAGLLAARARSRCIVDGHGDLRPEHIWINDSIRIIDCLEFNPKLRAVDPLDEIAFLSIECDRLGASWAANYLKRRVLRRWGDGRAAALFSFYRCYRATLRARLSAAHLIEASPRTPEKWLPLARLYLQIAAADTLYLERILKPRTDRRSPHPHGGGGRLRQKAPPPEPPRSFFALLPLPAGTGEPNPSR
jgi:aminoglycoside phosphotransferase family enzyme